MSAAAIYRAVIDDVIKNVREEFLREGIDDSVLLLLQQNWELKLAQENTVPAFTSATLDPSLIMPLPPLPSPTPFHNPPVPRPAGMGIATPAPAIPHITPAQPYNPSSVHAQRPAMPSHVHHLPPIASQSLPQHVTHNFLAGTDEDRSPLPSFSPAQFNPPATWTPQSQQAAAAANRKHPTDSNLSAPPQKRLQLARPPGAAPAVGRQADGAGDEAVVEGRAVADRLLHQLIAGVPREQVLGQVDGIGDDDDDDDDDPLGPGGPKLGSQDSGLEKLVDDDLGPDLDDEEEKELETEHLVVCQFEKVTRVKNKRKCNLKDGIMQLNGKDYLFHKATGEFDW